MKHATSRNIRFGCFLPIPAVQTNKLSKIAVANEKSGFDSIWVPDHLVFVPPGIVPEAWSTLAAIAVNTEKATLGSCVSDPHRHHPAVLAQKVATVDQISGGRVILGLGAGEAMNLEPFGIEWERPVSKLVEFVTIIRKLWAGDVLDYEGSFFKLKEAFLQIRPVQSRVPIYFGANSPRTLRLTGELADGWLSVPLSPQLYRERLKLVKEGVKRSDKSLEDIDTGIYLYTSVAEEAEVAYKQIENIKAQVISSPELLRKAGFNIELPDEIQKISYFNTLPDSEWVQRFLTFSELVPREAAIEFSIAGTVEDCIDKITEFIKAGVRHFLLLNAGPNPHEVMKVYGEEIIPYFKN